MKKRRSVLSKALSVILSIALLMSSFVLCPASAQDASAVTAAQEIIGLKNKKYISGTEALVAVENALTAYTEALPEDEETLLTALEIAVDAFNEAIEGEHKDELLCKYNVVFYENDGETPYESFPGVYYGFVPEVTSPDSFSAEKTAEQVFDRSYVFAYWYKKGDIEKTPVTDFTVSENAEYLPFFELTVDYSDYPLFENAQKELSEISDEVLKLEVSEKLAAFESGDPADAPEKYTWLKEKLDTDYDDIVDDSLVKHYTVIFYALFDGVYKPVKTLSLRRGAVPEAPDAASIPNYLVKNGSDDGNHDVSFKFNKSWSPEVTKVVSSEYSAKYYAQYDVNVDYTSYDKRVTDMLNIDPAETEKLIADIENSKPDCSPEEVKKLIDDFEKDLVTLSYVYRTGVNTENTLIVRLRKGTVLSDRITLPSFTDGLMFTDGDYDACFRAWQSKGIDVTDLRAAVSENTVYTATFQKKFVEADYTAFDVVKERAETMINGNDLTDEVILRTEEIISGAYDESGKVLGRTKQSIVNDAAAVLEAFLDRIDENGNNTVENEEYLNHYRVTFTSGGKMYAVIDGILLNTPWTSLELPENPVKAPDEASHYIFLSWLNVPEKITADVTVSADYASQPHTPQDDVSVTPTCTEGGFKGGVICSVCRAVLTPGYDLEPYGHSVNYNNSIFSKTALDGTYRWSVYQCVRCDYKTTKLTLVVFDETGKPINGAYVELTTENGEIFARGKTNSSGEFTPNDALPEGSYNVNITLEGTGTKGSGVLTVSDNSVSGDYTDGKGYIKREHCETCICHKSKVFGPIMRGLFTFLSVIFNTEIKCCPDMEWYGSYAGKL